MIGTRGMSASQRTHVERVYREQGEKLWRAVLAFSGDPAISDDAVSEAFAQLLRGRDSIRSPEAWVWTAAFRIARGLLAERGRTAELTEAAGHIEAPEPTIDLLRALRVLSATQRGAVVLHYFAGYSTKEIASILDSTPGAVRVHLSIGRRRLRSMLEDRWTSD